MATNNDDASSSADSPHPFLEDEHLGIVDEKRVRGMKRKASVNYYDVFSGLIALISRAKWPIEKKGSKAVKKKRSTSNNECAKCSELLAFQVALLFERASRRNEANRLRDEISTLRDEVDTLRDEVDTLRDEVDMLRDEATVKTMSIVTNDVFPNPKDFWRQEKRNVMMKRMRERKDGTSNMDCLKE